MNKNPLKRLLNHLRGKNKKVFFASLFSILNKIFDLAPPVLIGAAVDIVVRKEDSILAEYGYPDPKDQISVLAILTVIIWAMESLFQYCYACLWRTLAQEVQHSLRTECYSHVQNLHMGWFKEQSQGDLMSVMNDDINQLERFLDEGANDLLQVATTVIVISAAFFSIESSIAVWAMLPIPFIILGSFKFQNKISPRYALVRKRVGELNALLANNLMGISTIKSFTKEKYETERIKKSSNLYVEANKHAISLSSAFTPLIRMVIVVGFTATLVYGGNLALTGKLEVAAYSVMVFMTQRLLWPLTNLGRTFDLYHRAMASTVRVLDLLDTKIEVREGGLTFKKNNIRGKIQFKNVSFGYEGRPPLFKNLDLSFDAGSTVGIVGATGSGKTTLIRLLLRFYDPSKGKIFLDDEDISNCSIKSLRDVIGLVSQKTILFPGSIEENIKYGSEKASQEDMYDASKISESEKFIGSLPERYNTKVGEGGEKLSVGQRQRLSIARAIIKKAPIIIFDEATSSVDNETELAIQKSLSVVSKNKTTIIIAHRLSTVRKADIIFVLKDGKLVESGKHERLIKTNSYYKNLWDIQTGRIFD
tara:strand:- start:3129 stop:4898 length:1770 start_codon:yes stop_codon:yes gene_type:complete